MDKVEKGKLIALLNCHDDDVYCFRKELIESLKGQGYSILISCPYGKKLELMQDIGYEFINTPIDRRGTNIITDFKLLMHYYSVFKKNRPDLILTYTAKPNIYGSIAAGWLKIPYINNVTGLGIVIKKIGPLRNLMIALFKRAFKKSSCVFFQNEENIEMAIRYGLIRGKYRLIPGSGVNVKKFSLQPYPSDSEKIVFNYIGRVLKDKAIDDYIEAAKRIRAKYDYTEFNIIGFIEPTEIHYANELNELQEKGIIIYRGNQLDVRPLIARSHCTIHPSTYGEGMSNVLLESAASGRPVITTNIAGCREIVDNGVTGFIYHAGNIDELVLKIEEFIGLGYLKKKQMGLCGRLKVEREFSRESVVNAYLSEISQICI